MELHTCMQTNLKNSIEWITFEEIQLIKLTEVQWIDLQEAGGMAQAIKHLLTKCEALSLNPNIATKKKEN
jgi:hypothetical protein